MARRGEEETGGVEGRRSSCVWVELNGLVVQHGQPEQPLSSTASRCSYISWSVLALDRVTCPFFPVPTIVDAAALARRRLESFDSPIDLADSSGFIWVTGPGIAFSFQRRLSPKPVAASLKVDRSCALHEGFTFLHSVSPKRLCSGQWGRRGDRPDELLTVRTIY